jgi:ribosomal protein S18 acetylase RimI-like enzyme
LAAEDALRLALEADPRAARLTFRATAGGDELRRWAIRGYAPDGGLLHAIAPLPAGRCAIPAPIGTGIVLRDMRPEEAAGVSAFINGVYGWQRLTPGDLESWTRAHPPFSPAWIQVAEVDGTIASALAARPDTESAVRTGGLRGYIGPAATLPAYRGRGLATALATRALNTLSACGMRTVALHVHESNRPILSLMNTLGFRVAHHWTFMVKPVPP